MSDTMLALAARVEAAEGPDRALDAEIAVAVTPGMFSEGGYVGFTGKGDMRPPSFYTASLDAAMTLVPEGWDWIAENHVETGAGASAAQSRDWSILWVDAATPALALTAAALRARMENWQ